MNEKKKKDLKQRILSGTLSVTLITLILFAAQSPQFSWLFATAVAAFAALALWEYYQLLKHKQLHPPIKLGMVLTVAYIFAVFIKTQGPYEWAGALWARMPELILGAAFFSFFAYYALGKRPAIVHIATAFLGFVYIAIPCGMMIRSLFFFTNAGTIDPLSQGTWWLVYLLAVTKSTDIGGYFVGNFLGKTKLAPKISPNKTIEGAIGGLAAAICVSLIVCFLGRHFGGVFDKFSYQLAMGLGLTLGILAQLGDLAESLLKRDADVKDSNIIPGVGGVLDMVDSLLFTAPVIVMVLKVLYT